MNVKPKSFRALLLLLVLCAGTTVFLVLRDISAREVGEEVLARVAAEQAKYDSTRMDYRLAMEADSVKWSRQARLWPHETDDAG